MSLELVDTKEEGADTGALRVKHTTTQEVEKTYTINEIESYIEKCQENIAAVQADLDFWVDLKSQIETTISVAPVQKKKIPVDE